MIDDDAEARETEAHTQGAEQYSASGACGAESITADVGQTNAGMPRLMEAVVERSNVWAASQRVVRNGGGPGVDGQTAGSLKDWLRTHWPSVRAALLSGDYRPSAVRAVDIPKPSGGIRTLGIPTVLDRLIQQALLQVLQPTVEPTFSSSSYGFRPGRSAHQALKAAKRYVQEGRQWAVDLDLEKFFDRVNHDILMSRVARHVDDERVLKLIRRYLEAGWMREGVEGARNRGTPQGGPLSPLLSNILLTDWDRELERRGHAFCRYADDCNIYVRSEVAGRRVMAQMKVFLQKRLKLHINEAKSACARPWKRKFLGYTLTAVGKIRLRFARESVAKWRDRIRELLRQGRGRSLTRTIETLNPVLRGWVSYFQLSESRVAWEELDVWLRRRLRCLIWDQAKTRQRRTALLRQGGIDPVRAWHSARNGHGSWWNADALHMRVAFPNAFFHKQGLVCLTDTVRYLQRHS
ncbi:group II intron reverse transcriptase/maturase [Dyella jejuensis]|uniref:RNA-directed DNA polymerase n=1 Tax=Dyella jejuensis TaxID=1432009 RepID=A0ABW8JIM6_9GAMM